jgi:2-C-methyl-D-erythritol 4-phosphate cytidylyltransferase
MSSDSSGEPVGAVLFGDGDGMEASEELLWAVLAGRHVLAWSLQALADVPRITEVILLVTPGREAAANELVEALPSRPGHKIKVAAAIPAPAAANALLDAVKSLAPACRLVVIHHGNRPLVTAGSVALAIAAADEHPGSGVVAAAPVSETIKRTRDQLVVDTPPRAGLLVLGTPQVFPREALIRAYRSQLIGSGSSGLAGRLEPIDWALEGGMRVLPITIADGENLAITRWDDLRLAEALLQGSR